MMAGVGKFTFDWFKNVQIKTQLLNQNLTSELAFLKSQINPHFLFNTLNNIHTLAYKKSDDAPESIMKLSELMRYMIYESNADKVSLKKEMVHLRSFIDLQELRFKTKGIVQLKVDGDVEVYEIAPLLLLPLVENAFKHGEHLNRIGAIQINLSCDDSAIHFHIQNEWREKQDVQKDKVGGIGLENIQRRLELIYKEQFTLEIEKSSPHYTVSLTIKNNG